MPHSLVITAIVAATIAGDYALKLASERTDVLTPHLVAGIILYALPAFGWMYLMKSQSLAQIGVVYSTSTILALFFMSLVVFREALSIRVVVAALFALGAILTYKH